MAMIDVDNELTSEPSVADGRLICRMILPLKDLASITAAVTLYSPSFMKLSEWEELYSFKYGRKNDTIRYLPLPLSIQNMLGRYVNYTIDKIIKWGEHHCYNNIFYETCAVVFNNHICEIAWTSDGEIDYRKTALKMLSHPDVEEQEKFKIAASLCLENHMRRMWPLKSADQIESLLDEEEGYTLIYYWYHYFKGDLCDGYFSANDITDGCLGNRHSHVVIYFCKRYSLYEQESIISLMENYSDALFQKDLLLEMNASQQLNFLKVVGVGRVIVNFTRIQNQFEHAVSIWEYIRNTIDQEQYFHMLTDILQQAVRIENVWTPNCNLIDFIDIMWKTTPSNLKLYAADVKDGAVMNLLTSFKNEFHFGAQFAILVPIIPNIELRFRQDILHKISSLSTCSFISSTPWEKVIERTGRSLLFDKFVKLCIPNSEEQAAFKRKWISSKFMNRYGVKLIELGEWKELDEFITIFESNIMSLAEYKIHLFTKLVSTDDNYKGSIDRYLFDMIDWPHTPSHEWKRFWSGIDEQRLIGVLTDFRGVTNDEVRYLVLENLFPNFDVGSIPMNFHKC